MWLLGTFGFITRRLRLVRRAPAAMALVARLAEGTGVQRHPGARRALHADRRLPHAVRADRRPAGRAGHPGGCQWVVDAGLRGLWHIPRLSGEAVKTGIPTAIRGGSGQSGCRAATYAVWVRRLPPPGASRLRGPRAGGD